jgi:hypothetical protein
VRTECLYCVGRCKIPQAPQVPQAHFTEAKYDVPEVCLWCLWRTCGVLGVCLWCACGVLVVPVCFSIAVLRMYEADPDHSMNLWYSALCCCCNTYSHGACTAQIDRARRFNYAWCMHNYTRARLWAALAYNHQLRMGPCILTIKGCQQLYLTHLFCGITYHVTNLCGIPRPTQTQASRCWYTFQHHPESKVTFFLFFLFYYTG